MGLSRAVAHSACGLSGPFARLGLPHWNIDTQSSPLVLAASPDFAALLAPASPVDIATPTLLFLVVAAAALSIPRTTWRWFGLFTTLVHELGHALAAVLTGRFVHGIRIHGNHSGDATSSGRGGFGSVVSGVFGYPAPAIVGAGLLWSVFSGYTAAALLVGGIILLVTILVVRNLVGVLVVLVSAAVAAALWFYATPEFQGYALLVLGIALLVGSVRGLATVVGVHTGRRTQLRTSDAYLLFRSTGVPSPVWLGLFAVLIGGSVAFAASVYVATYGSPLS